MKRIILTLIVFAASFAVQAQDIDSTRIEQTFVLKQKYVLHFFASLDWGNTDVINALNQFRPQYDSANNEKPITLTSPSGLYADGMQRLSFLPEGEATAYNDEMLTAAGGQVTNPWLSARMQTIREENWRRRDARIQATADRLKLIKPL